MADLALFWRTVGIFLATFLAYILMADYGPFVILPFNLAGWALTMFLNGLRRKHSLLTWLLGFNGLAVLMGILLLPAWAATSTLPLAGLALRRLLPLFFGLALTAAGWAWLERRIRQEPVRTRRKPPSDAADFFALVMLGFIFLVGLAIAPASLSRYIQGSPAEYDGYALCFVLLALFFLASRLRTWFIYRRSQVRTQARVLQDERRTVKLMGETLTRHHVTVQFEAQRPDGSLQTITAQAQTYGTVAPGKALIHYARTAPLVFLFEGEY